ncbi:dephospho-CoA kinase [Tepidibacter hydrothermalis]|uniref:Dephospho-CoA kinase n=1 Tax=Tepidibacter hydrothermalis TaxID=3036126 RepID=A0ABY8EEQ7_9FIRM|nr:dephospho-CoA kinase [Tepidibacter hydrothermalis]WFD11421.1 dephospho-CoA kinase [Tepidibacter hydrothermalis]
MIVIGLTGSIGSGKSTVSNILKKKNINIIDADEISRKIFDNKKDLDVLVEYFGSEILDSDNMLDRKKLGSIVFSDENKLEKLNSITHPIIINNIKVNIDKFNKQGEKIVILDAPLLIEANLLNLVDMVLLVTCNENIQIKRIVKRDNISKEDATLRIRSQMSVEDKKKYADYIIDNSYDQDKLEADVEKFCDYVEETYLD